MEEETSSRPALLKSRGSCPVKRDDGGFAPPRRSAIQIKEWNSVR